MFNAETLLDHDQKIIRENAAIDELNIRIFKENILLNWEKLKQTGSFIPSSLTFFSFLLCTAIHKNMDSFGFQHKRNLVRTFSPFHDQHPLFLHTLISDEYKNELGEEVVKLGFGNKNINNRVFYLVSLVGLEENNNNCKQKLERICSNANVKTLDHEIQNICTHISTICSNSKSEVSKKIQEVIQSLSSKTDLNHQCRMLQMECYFLEKYNSELSSKCTTLKERCYIQLCKGLAKKILYNLLKKTLSTTTYCLKELKSECLSLSQKSPELLDLCINSDHICGEFVSESNRKCQVFQKQLLLQKEKEITEDNCKIWLKKCYFTFFGCQSIYAVCRSFQADCAEKGFFYDILSDFDLSLFENPFAVPKQNVVESGYSKLDNLGIYVGEVSKFNDMVFTSFLIQNGNTETENCEKELNKKCALVDYLNIFKLICTKKSNNGKHDTCIEINDKGESHFQSYFKNFTNNKSLSTFKNSFSKEECAKYLSLCYFITSYIDHWDKSDICKEIRVFCCQTGLETVAKINLIKEMNGQFTFVEKSDKSLDRTATEDSCQLYLFLACKKHMHHNYHIFTSCLHLKETCEDLISFLEEKCKEMNGYLKKINKKFTRHSCGKTREECNNLKSCDKSTLGLCWELETYCRKMDKLNKLKLEMLNNQSLSLQSISVCVGYLQTYCSENNAAYGCTKVQNTCLDIFEELQNDCDQFFELLGNYLNTLYDVSYAALSRCFYFENYCLLYSSCPSSNLCEKIAEICNTAVDRHRNLLALARTLGGEIPTVELCEKKLEKCKESENQEKKLLCSKTNECNSLVPYLKKVCDEFILKISSYFHTISNLTTKCNKVQSLCLFIGSSCTGINDRVSSICANFINKCELSTPLPSTPGSEPVPEQLPESKPVSGPGPEPGPKPGPKPGPEPGPVPGSVPGPGPKPEPGSESGSKPKPDSESGSKPKPDSESGSKPKPDSESGSKPKPDSESGSKPKPDSESGSKPKPDSESGSKPKPDSESAPKPGSESAPKPGSEPAPSKPKPSDSSSSLPTAVPSTTTPTATSPATRKTSVCTKATCSTSTRLRARPTILPSDDCEDDYEKGYGKGHGKGHRKGYGKGYGIRTQGLYMIELFWITTGVILGSWILV
ncbi:hypothetical protein PMAC_002353 [Pneumocystis sp. 'macacae']|nr:hypothetical protein PMAC_002353 [Pneumocystis sp. 'macacae']